MRRGRNTRRFDRAIERLTRRAIEESLAEISAIFARTYSTPKEDAR